jgi:signal transduction histidine kinase
MITRLTGSAVFRLTLLTVALIGLAAAAIVAGVGAMAGRALIEGTEAAIRSDALELRGAFTGGGVRRLEAMVGERSQGAGAGLYYLGDTAGRRLAGNLAELPRIGGGGQAAGTFAYTPPTGGPQRIAAGRAVDLDSQHFLVIGRDIEDQRRLIAGLTRGLAAGLVALALMGLGGAALLALRIQGRIDAISEASRAIMAGDLAGRIPRRGSDDELDRLAGQLNAMLDRIEQLMAGLREVSDNIAHDLKTPLNRLRNRAEAALSDPRDGEAWRSGLERTIEDADALIKTFNALLLIARLEAGVVEGAETVDAAEVAADVSELYAPAAEDAGFPIEVRAAAAAPVTANRQLLGQALANLIDNAIKYSVRQHAAAGAGGPIVVGVRTVGRDVEITVGDHGPGIAPELRERALRRFGRLETSRTPPGTGLGLSLVAAVARMHGGSVRLDDNRPGLLVVVTLPLAGATVAAPLEPAARPPQAALGAGAKA